MRPLPAPALRRSGAARRHRARHRQRPEDHRRRRAHRRPRPQERRRHPRRCSSKLNREFKKTILMVTHDPAAAERATDHAPPRQGSARSERSSSIAARNVAAQQVPHRPHGPRRRRRDRSPSSCCARCSSSWTVARRVRRQGPPRHAPQGLASSCSCPSATSRTSGRCPGVKDATWANWFGGKDPEATRTSSSRTIAVDPTSFLDVYDEIVVPAGAEGRPGSQNRKGAHRRRRARQEAGLEGRRQGHAAAARSIPGDWEFNDRRHLHRARASRSIARSSCSTGTT